MKSWLATVVVSFEQEYDQEYDEQAGLEFLSCHPRGIESPVGGADGQGNV